MKKRILSILLAIAMTVGLFPAISLTMAAAGETSTPSDIFEYEGTTYTVGLLEWTNGDTMPIYFGSGYPNGGSRGTDEDFELEHVVCIKTGAQGSEVPASAEIFSKIEDVSYTLEITYTPESEGKVTQGDVRTVTRDTSTGDCPVTTRAFSIFVPGTSYFNMNITAVITMNLDGRSVELTVTRNFQKPNDDIEHRTLRLDNYIDDCDSTEELQNIIKDRESLWHFYIEKGGCSIDDLIEEECGGDPLKVILPAGTYGDLTFDLSERTTTVGAFTGMGENVSNSEVKFDGPIAIWGSDDGTTIGSLTYTSTDADGMSAIVRINFDGTETNEDYGLLVTSNEALENGYFGPTGVNNCTFNGYKTAIISSGNGYAVPSGCTFTNNTTAIYINCGNSVFVSPNITRCTFKNNDTAVYLNSLGTSCSPYSFRVTMCDFIGNEVDVNYQQPGVFYLFHNYYADGDGHLKRMAVAIKGENTTIKQGVWRDKSHKHDDAYHGITDGGVKFNDDETKLADDYLEDVSFDIISGTESEATTTVGTWTFE